jgi:transcriptional regulator GlxA family with amidase domain
MRRIAFLVFPDFQLLDAAGPIAAFEVANSFAPDAYRVEVRAERAGPVRSSSGVVLEAQGLGRSQGIHTLLVAGGDGVDRAARSARLVRFVRACSRGAKAAPRLASVCSGTYLLAQAGLLDDKRATTHWCRTRDFQERFPRVRLEPDKIYVRAGNIWSSAGISAGVDLALALITEDLGERLARRVARQLVVYYRRPGGQSQFSSLLDLESGRFESLLDYMRTHLTEPLTVPDLARRVGMSSRNFSRVFLAEVGQTPAKAVERLRVEAAQTALETRTSSVAEVAIRTGFGAPERLRRALVRCSGAPPSTLRRAHTQP